MPKVARAVYLYHGSEIERGEQGRRACQHRGPLTCKFASHTPAVGFGLALGRVCGFDSGRQREKREKEEDERKERKEKQTAGSVLRMAMATCPIRTRHSERGNEKERRERW